jgi:nucleotide-binding universal stress UspA family protein
MTIRNSLVMVTGDHAAAAVEAAFTLAEQSRGHVTGLHVTGDTVMNMPSIIEGMTERQIVTEFERMRSRLETSETTAREMFTAACARHGGVLAEAPVPTEGVTASWEVAKGRPEKVPAEKARVYDLLISGANGEVAGEGVLGAVETALFDAGRPVLVIPRETPKVLGKNILIGWNRTANAARAVMAAMPLIEAAEQVTICHVNTGAKPGPSPEELAASLAWHGIDAKVRYIAAGGAAVSDLLMTEAANTGGDLVIMGAYSHSRMREFVLGGVTRHALRHVVTPLMMMH